MKNPIINNRIVSDITFATRLKHFLQDIQVNDPMSQEELDYFRIVANHLLDYQLETMPKEEEWYHKTYKNIK